MTDVKIRPVRPDDAPAMAILASQPKVVWGTLQLPAQTAEQWRKRFEGLDLNVNYMLAAELDGQVVGLLGLHGSGRARARHCATLGMMVHDRYQRRGVGRALMTAGLDAADRWLNLLRLELEVFPDNLPAVALYEKFGFVHEGRKRLNAFRDGRYVDSLMMARLRPGFDEAST